MRIGIIVDGQAESRSLRSLTEKIDTQNDIVGPIYADIQPYAPVPQIALSIRKRLDILASKRVEHAVVLFDRENRPECSGELANAVGVILDPERERFGFARISVVIKDRKFENWLVSDVGAITRMPGRFQFNVGQLERISRIGADNIDALELLKSAAVKDSYSKVDDARKILHKSDPDNMALTSRSFRRFLRVVGNGRYSGQSKLPN